MWLIAALKLAKAAMSVVSHKPPELSVVMPSRNQAGYIERAVRSVLGQGDVDLELIVMDGGSTDGTQQILSRLATEANGRLRWTSEADKGPAHALNKAMAQARGEVLGWLNSDDLYRPGAADRALRTLRTRPDWLMVYGHGEHIDACDRPIGPYPTRGPETPVQQFAEGCFICQPTVFFRKALLDKIGPLDEQLGAAFDFDWWLRLFKQAPAGIGFVDAIQAASRLHRACLTLADRETVIREGMRVLARHLGACPLNWFKTYVDEFLAEYPHGRQIGSLRKHLRAFADSVHSCLTIADQQELRVFLERDKRIQLALPDACIGVYPDGWLPPRSMLRVRCRRRGLRGVWRRIELHGRHVSPGNAPLDLRIHRQDGECQTHRIEHRGRFRLDISLPHPGRLPAYWAFDIEAEGGFVPSELDRASIDSRRLACLIEAIRLRTD